MKKLTGANINISKWNKKGEVNMVKSEVIKQVSEVVNKGRSARLRYSYRDIENVMKAYADVVVETLTKNTDEKVGFEGLGFFSVKHIPEKTRVSYLSSEPKEYVLSAKDKLIFKPSRNYKTLA